MFAATEGAGFENTLSQLIAAAQSIGTTVIQAKTQRKLVDLDIARVRAGYAPAGGGYGAGTDADLPPGNYAPPVSNLKPLLILGGVGLLAFLVLRR